MSQTGLYGSDRTLLSPIAQRLAERDVLKWVIAITAALGAILEVIDTSIVNVAMPDIQGNLGATLAEVGWISTGYACANVVMIPLTAWLGHRFGRRQYLVFSLAGFTAASVLCGLSTSLMMLIVARVLQGFCGGGLLAKAQSILFETFSRKEQPAAQALFGIGVIAGPAFGPLLGGYLTDTFGWRSIFFINLPIGIFAIAMTIVFLPRDVVGDLLRKSVDWLGIGLLAVTLGCFQTMLEEGQQDDWFASRFILTMAAGAIVGLVFFVWRELTTEYPAVDLRVLRHRSLAAGSLYSLVLGMGLYGVIFAVPIFVQNYLHFTAMQSGLLLMPGGLASAVMMVIMGKVSGRVDPRALIACGALTTVATALLLAQINPDTGTNSLFLPLVLRGLGSVMMFLPLSLATLGSLPQRDIAAGSGFYNLTRQMGSSIGIALITTVLAHREAVHRSVLVEHITTANPATAQRMNMLAGAFAQHSADPVATHQQAWSAIDHLVSGQALLLSFADVFLYVAIAFIATLPLLFLLGKGGNKAAAAAAH
ncbi:DHA2 family efflux MFS transporter permease subunit [Horticoccus luteus]|uniref:DHA2 family efflux MFS transporter permease subunit n=1 Tax=Horticoccus luteus TaxID=2862869 RepID=A0A8F9XK97_9BACT|nr:DHA2 family efflux MFS transporter permease subunit [Horticoccus luteus]QYM79478.1 DHA2 family efflux MFS transporter permease subunit [Horticoccus luteus]